MVVLKNHLHSSRTRDHLRKRFASTPGGSLEYANAWFGIGACQFLGSSRYATTKDVWALCEDRHPHTGAPLELLDDNPRPKRRRHRLTEVVFRLPRLLASFTDPRIADSHRNTCATIMRDLELHAAARVLEGHVPMLLCTSNLVGVTFDSFAEWNSVDLLQTHYLLFDLTFDEEAQAWRSLDASDMTAEYPDLDDLYCERLSHELEGVGWRVSEERIGDFERQSLCGLN